MYHLLSSKNCFITNGFSLEIGGGGSRGACFPNGRRSGTIASTVLGLNPPAGRGLSVVPVPVSYPEAPILVRLAADNNNFTAKINFDVLPIKVT